MARAYLEVVRVMRGGYLHHAGAELHIHIVVRHHRDFLIHQRQNNRLAVQVRIAPVRRVHGNGRVAQHGLGAGGGKLYEFICALHRIFQMPEKAVLLFILHLGVGNGRLAVRAPVDDALPPVDEALVIQLFKHLQNGLRAALVHGEALALPIARAAQLFQLLYNAPAVLLFPIPRALQKLFAAKVRLGEALFFHFGHYLRLGGDGGVVCTGHPKRGVALHALIADEDVLPGLVHGVAHVQLARNIGRRHHNSIGLFACVALGVKHAAFLPGAVQPVLHLAWVVHFFQLFHSDSSLFRHCGFAGFENFPSIQGKYF